MVVWGSNSFTTMGSRHCTIYSVADLHHLDADPDADPDPACHFDADSDPDPTYNLSLVHSRLLSPSFQPKDECR